MIYLRYLLGTAFILMALVAALNYFVDPGAIYAYAAADPRRYVEALVSAPNGLWWPDNSFQDRQIKKALVQYAGGAGCVVIGSSRAMLIGSARSDRLFADECPTILNLAVSSGGLEDDIVLAYLAAMHGPPRKLILGLDPWTFAFNVNNRWSYYADDYARAVSEMGVTEQMQPFGASSGSFLNKLRNLFSLEYTARALSQALAEVGYGGSRFSPKEAPPVDPQTGGRYPVLLRDGSVIYSARYIAGTLMRAVPVGGEPPTRAEAFHDPQAIQAFIGLVMWLKSRGIEPILLLAPFHPNGWTMPYPESVRSAISAEAIARRIAAQQHLRLIGTYNSFLARCRASQFYDYLHANVHCLASLAH
jgi:hypothetical protein